MTEIPENLDIAAQEFCPLVEDFPVDYVQGESLEPESKLPTRCSICKENLTDAVILSCLHVFDKTCLKPFEKVHQKFPMTECPTCKTESGPINTLVPFDVGIIEDYSASSAQSDEGQTVQVAKCTLCTDNGDAISKCMECAGILCVTCLDVHKRMKMFSTHTVVELTDAEKAHPKELASKMNQLKPVECVSHRDHHYKHFCFQCNIPICDECLLMEHKGHVTSPIETATERIKGVIETLVSECSENRTKFSSWSEKLDAMITELHTSREQNKGHIEEVCNDWKAAIDDVKEEFLKRSRDLHNTLEMNLMNEIETVRNRIDHIDYSRVFSTVYMPRLSSVEYAKVCKSVLTCLEHLHKLEPPVKGLPTGIPFMDDRANIRQVLRTHYGWFDLGPDQHSGLSPIQPFQSALGAGFDNSALLAASAALPPVGFLSTGAGFRQVSPSNDFVNVLGSNSNVPSNGVHHNIGDLNQPFIPIDFPPPPLSGGLGSMTSLGEIPASSAGVSSFLPNVTQRNALRSAASEPFTTLFSDLPTTSGTPLYGMNSVLNNPLTATQSSGLGPQSLTRATNINGYNPNPNPPFPNRQGRCQAMNVRNRWGSLGPGPDQMNSPHGFCLGFDEDVVVADTQNHRILVFTKDGFTRTHFGIAGREEGQLWYPRKITVLRTSQKYVVCDRGSERSRMQVFTRNGHFLKKINIRYIDIVAGLAINNAGNIVAVDSVSPSVFIISEAGDLVHWFDCSEYMREPSDIAISQNEYFICDFKGHCVSVFTETGTFLRRIGSDAITNFPNGIDVSDFGDILIGDSHGNRFHVAVFDRTGELRGEFECPNLKVSRCCGLKITSEGFLVTLAKNNNQVFIIDTLYVN